MWLGDVSVTGGETRLGGGGENRFWDLWGVFVWFGGVYKLGVGFLRMAFGRTGVLCF